MQDTNDSNGVIWKTIYLVKSCCILSLLIITNQVHLTSLHFKGTRQISMLTFQCWIEVVRRVLWWMSACCNSKKAKEALPTISMCQGHAQTATPQLLNAQLLLRWTWPLQKGQYDIVITNEVIYVDKTFCPLCMSTSSTLICLFTRLLLVHVNLYSSTRQLPPPSPLPQQIQRLHRDHVVVSPYRWKHNIGIEFCSQKQLHLVSF